ncbi:hypothetical protein CAOG_009987 [Capsaspora owczarzaki ATCC 30864]|uniref:Uncharacterized protein n=1 Tax=Capsaspora owczarzaki (strain ATCC 30864) TaxID=595528 RepID=A0A0D2WV99_CAPO3|nr:hypothetical protein CAOG_009987 [Capsaspora owczarzaki ATCC 30864]
MASGCYEWRQVAAPSGLANVTKRQKTISALCLFFFFAGTFWSDSCSGLARLLSRWGGLSPLVLWPSAHVVSQWSWQASRPSVKCGRPTAFQNPKKTTSPRPLSACCRVDRSGLSLLLAACDGCVPPAIRASLALAGSRLRLSSPRSFALGFS